MYLPIHAEIKDNLQLQSTCNWMLYIFAQNIYHHPFVSHTLLVPGSCLMTWVFLSIWYISCCSIYYVCIFITVSYILHRLFVFVSINFQRLLISTKRIYICNIGETCNLNLFAKIITKTIESVVIIENDTIMPNVNASIYLIEAI